MVCEHILEKMPPSKKEQNRQNQLIMEIISWREGGRHAGRHAEEERTAETSSHIHSKLHNDMRKKQNSSAFGTTTISTEAACSFYARLIIV